MIIVKILGGLGNQLFQYAAGKALAEEQETELKLDILHFEGEQKRNFELDNFNTKVSLATKEEIENLKANSTLSRAKSRFTPYRYKRFYKQPYFHFDKRFFSLGNNVYIKGYFQSQKYFLPIKERIHQEFELTNGHSQKVMEICADLKSKQSIALHIRRGDYKDAVSLNVHGILPIVYYQKAIDFFKSQFGNEARFYIFSDDPVTAQRELNLEKAILVSGNFTQNHLDDFYLMSKCKHNIIANSSFSWWAAWLNKNEVKKIVAPINWFNKGPKDTYDLFPENWIKI